MAWRRVELTVDSVASERGERERRSASRTYDLEACRRRSGDEDVKETRELERQVRRCGSKIMNLARRWYHADVHLPLVVTGNVEVLAGRVVKNQDMIERGQSRKGL